MAYATQTQVPVSRSKAQIEDLLRKYGAKQFGAAWDEAEGLAFIMFTILAEDGTPRQIRMTLPIPDPANYSTDKKAEQAERSAWRSLHLVVKAKLEAVASGISTIEREFLADVVLPNKKTLSEEVAPFLADAYKSGKMPRLLGGR